MAIKRFLSHLATPGRHLKSRGGAQTIVGVGLCIGNLRRSEITRSLTESPA